MTNIKANTNGFTLLEMLFVLSFLSIIILFALPIHHNTITDQTEKQFLKILQYDMLYIQNLAMTSNDQVSIRFKDNHYVILQGKKEVLPRRLIPSGFSINMNTMEKISFNSKGTIRESGSITIKTSQSTYKFICPLGKGRCYIEQ